MRAVRWSSWALAALLCLLGVPSGADDTIDADASGASEFGDSYPRVAWSDSSTLYVLQREVSSNHVELWYGDPTAPTFGDVGGSHVSGAFDMWADWWTDGDNGDILHIAWITTTDDGVHYREFNTSTDTFVAAALKAKSLATCAAATAEGSQSISIVKTPSGMIYINYWCDAVGEHGIIFCDDAVADCTATAANWTDATVGDASNPCHRGNPAQHTESIPADTGDDDDFYFYTHLLDPNGEVRLIGYDASADNCPAAQNILCSGLDAYPRDGDEKWIRATIDYTGANRIGLLCVRGATAKTFLVPSGLGTTPTCSSAATEFEANAREYCAPFVDQSTSSNNRYVFYYNDAKTVNKTPLVIRYCSSTWTTNWYDCSSGAGDLMLDASGASEDDFRTAHAGMMAPSTRAGRLCIVTFNDDTTQTIAADDDGTETCKEFAAPAGGTPKQIVQWPLPLLATELRIP